MKYRNQQQKTYKNKIKKLCQENNNKKYDNNRKCQELDAILKTERERERQGEKGRGNKTNNEIKRSNISAAILSYFC